MRLNRFENRIGVLEVTSKSTFPDKRGNDSGAADGEICLK